MSENLAGEATSENSPSKKVFGPKYILIAATVLVVSVIAGLFASGAFNFTDKKAKANYELAMNPIKSDLEIWRERVTEASASSVSAYKVILPDLLKDQLAIQKRAEAVSPGSEELVEAHKSYLKGLFHQEEALKALITALSYDDQEQFDYFVGKATPHNDAALQKFEEHNLLLSLIEDSE